MKSLFTPKLPALVALLLLAGLHVLCGQPQPPTVSKIEIRHVGPPAASDALIQGNIRIKEGDVYQPGRVDDDVRNLYATGYFYNIRVADEMTPAGIVLTYVVQGNPTITDIKYTGNKRFNNTKLQKKVTSKVGEPLDEKKLFSDAREIEKMYQKVGYQKTTVKPLLSIDENAGRGTVTFEVNETGKTKIKDIVFEGADAFSQKKLRKVLKTKRRWMFSWLTGSGVLKDEQFADDKERLIEFYQNAGYIDFEIEDIKFDYIDDKKLVIRFQLSEGKQYKVGAVDFKGNELFTQEEILKGITVAGKPVRVSMIVDETFTPKGLSKDIEAIRDFYGSKGYIDLRVSAVKRPNTTAGTMDLVYEIQEGQKAFVEKIDIKDSEKTKDKVIRRELAIYPGEFFDTTRVKLSKDRLEGLNYFEKVEPRPEDTDVPDRKNLVIGVEEKNTGNFTLGAGLSSVDSVVGFVEVSQANFDLFKPPTFTGAGQKFRLRAQVGTKRQDYQISFVEPWFLDRKLALGVDLYHRELNFVSRRDLYEETRTGGSLSLTRALWSDFLIGKVSYTLENVDLNLRKDDISPEIALESGSRLISKVGSSLAYDTRNSALLPSRGQRTELLTELAGLGGDVDFYRLEGRTAWYFPGFFEGHIIELAGRVGVVDDYGSGDRGSPRVPIFDRWFLGGLYSLRGYRYRDVGPRDSTGEPLGGETYYFASAEYSLPIIERLRFAMFYDIGNVFEDAYSFVAKGRKAFSDNWGVGLRINLPIGPLRLDYGVPINHDSDVSGSGRFQFGVGYTREF